MSSSSSSPPLPSPPSTKHKRKREVEDDVDPHSDASDSDSDSSSSDSDSPNENGKVNTPAEKDDDAPVLSHAAKRKQKKKEQKLAKEEDDSAVPKKKRKLKNGAAAPEDAANGRGTKRQNSVWVGNMSFKTTEDNLRTFFKDKGAGDITRINMPTKAAKGPMKENRGFAYVDFETPEAKKAAIALSEQPLLGRKLLIKDGDDYTGRPDQPTVEASILRNQKQPPAATLFFGNLSFDATEDSIRELLEAHREKPKQKGKSKEELEDEEKPVSWIRKVRLGTFEDSGKCKGFGFVDFTSTEFATSALINPKNHHLNGRDLVVEYAGAEAVRRGAPKSLRPKSHSDTASGAGRLEWRSTGKKDTPPHRARGNDGEEDAMAVDAAEEAPQPFSKPNRQDGDRRRGNNDRDKGRPRGRPKPGAALALAKRESAAIVPSQGQKISF
ncbi:hypothetical protein NP233_g2697 [Leucocoprinus birnbaumii]|uniref:RRM domain-containing protein n=1 Tax=Leucocoprinus birnbaumii TaxID=56174 RepID=A0AAD5W0X0_9AGAR|nr:hypothetical protein NP233_g2697 [Leucocoprinus birnbaumii]